MQYRAIGIDVDACGAGRRQPSPEAAHETLCAALQEQASWEQRAHVAKELLHEMLKSRREAADLQQQYDIKFVPRSLACTSFAGLPAWHGSHAHFALRAGCHDASQPITSGGHVVKVK